MKGVPQLPSDARLQGVLQGGEWGKGVGMFVASWQRHALQPNELAARYARNNHASLVALQQHDSKENTHPSNGMGSPMAITPVASHKRKHEDSDSESMQMSPAFKKHIVSTPSGPLPCSPTPEQPSNTDAIGSPMLISPPLAIATAPKVTQVLGLAEESALRQHFASRLALFAKAQDLQLSSTITALLLYWRFYLACSVMDYGPDRIWPVCLAMACKLENHGSQVHSILTKCSVEDVGRWELVVLEKLGFRLFVHPVDRAVHGLVGELEGLQPRVSSASLASIENGAKELLVQVFTTDLPLLSSFPPATLSLCVVVMAMEGEGTDNSALLAHVGATREEVDPLVQRVKLVLKEIDAPHTREVLAKARRLVPGCRNPWCNPDSAAWIKAQEERRAREQFRIDELARIEHERRQRQEDDFLGISLHPRLPNERA